MHAVAIVKISDRYLTICKHAAGRFGKRICYYNPTIVFERNQAGIKGSVPVGRQQQAVVNVEPLGVRLALRPRHDVTRSKETWLCNARQRTRTLPIVHERSAEPILSDPLTQHSLRFGLPEMCDFFLKPFQRKIRHAASEVEYAINRIMQRSAGWEGVSSSKTTWWRSSLFPRQFRNHAGVVEREKPWSAIISGSHGERNFARHTLLISEK